MRTIDLDNGKYTVQVDDNGGVTCLRNGEDWRDCCGDSLIYFMALALLENQRPVVPFDELENGVWYWVANPREPDVGYPVYVNLEGGVIVGNGNAVMDKGFLSNLTVHKLGWP
ncbi:MAG: hypothetical protein COA47_10145 [Robiginitomaculum sp.]|nr:MAG: hypothetical protein COA47_10145 [Robiginitomaculum sp.]